MHRLMVLLKRVAVRIIDAFAEKPDPIAIRLQKTGIEQYSDTKKKTNYLLQSFTFTTLSISCSL